MKSANLTDSACQDRIIEVQKKYEHVLHKAKPQTKLNNLLNQTETQYLVFRKIQKWMRARAYSDKK